ncbi:MAG: flavin reductase family protein [archaeon]|nr:flavin reductase family protein [archaeon]
MTVSKSEKLDVKLDLATRLMYPRPMVLITCIDSSGKPNIIPVAWTMPISFNPPMVAISIALTRYSHKLIKETREFVINIPTKELVKHIDYLGSVSGKDVDKFKASNLTALPAKKVKPPLIGECVAHIECELVSKLDTGDHTIFIGKVVAAQANEDAFKNYYDLDNVKIVLRHEKRYLTTGEYI